MAATTETRPAHTSAGTGGQELHHYTCCDDNTAICGVDVSAQAWCDDKDSHHPRCPLCALAIEEGLPCTIPGCTEYLKRTP